MKRLSVLLCLALAGSAFGLPAGTRPNLNVFLDSGADQPLELPSKGMVAHVEEHLGLPSFYWAARGHAGRDSLRQLGLSPLQAARRHLFENAAMYRQDGALLAESPVYRVHDTGSGAIIVTFRKEIGEVRVFRDELRVIMDRDLELVALSGYLPPFDQVAVRGQPRPFNLDQATAVTAALFDLTGAAIESPSLRATDKVVEDYYRFDLTDSAMKTTGLHFGQPARARKVLFTLPDGLEPAYYVELEVGSSDEEASDLMYGYVVSAVDGRVLFRKNQTAFDAFQYRVWADANGMPLDGPHGTSWTPHPTGTPDGTDAPAIPPSLRSIAHGPISTNDVWLPSAAVDTRGNNVDAYADIASPDGFGTGDVRPQLSSPNAFDFPYDVTVSPRLNDTQIDAAVTQLFVDNNFFHDWYYDVGFDEKSGNGQVDNYGRGGLANDELRAEGQDFSGTDNANMSCPADGSKPRMQMYIFQGPSKETVTVTPTGGMPSNFPSREATWGPAVYDVSAGLVVMNDGVGTTTDGCEPAANGAQIAGNIVLVDRGICPFVTKVANAQAAGAIGILIANNRGSNPPYLIGTDPTLTIPTLGVSQTSGTTLKQLAETGASIQISRTAGVDRDGTVDNGIVAHEWGHYISNRLIGNASGLDTNQAGGMGEGWGDFHAMLLIVRAEDAAVASNANWAGVYSAATWVTTGYGRNGLYYGLRRVPYSTDFTKNALTFKHIQDGVALPTGVPTQGGTNGAFNSEVHNTGEVWATMLWECYASLLRDSSRLTFDQAQQRMREYLVAAYKATPNSPTILEARDALLAAAWAGDPADFTLFSDAFARRGAGQKAVAPPRNSTNNTPVVEDFTTGNQFSVLGSTLDDSVTSCDHDGHLDNGETGLLSVSIRNTGAIMLTQTTATVTSDIPGITFANGGVMTFPAVNPFETVTGKIEVTLYRAKSITDAHFTVTFADPDLGANVPAPETLAFRTNVEEAPASSTSDDVEASTTTWTTGFDSRLEHTKVWHRDVDGLNHVWFAPNPDSAADIYLESPDLFVSETEPLTVTFKHRYDFETNGELYFDGGVIELSMEGSAWQDLADYLSPSYPGILEAGQSSNPLKGRAAFVGRNANYPDWETVTIDLGSEYAGHRVKFRFRLGADDASAKTGWQLDDFVFTGIEGAPFDAAVTQQTTCGNEAPGIMSFSPMTVDEGTLVTLTGRAVDTDGDPLTWRWTQVQGPPVQLNGADQASPTFTAPMVDADTTLAFSLVVSDGKEDSVEMIQEVKVVNLDGKVGSKDASSSAASGCGCSAGTGPGLAPLWALLTAALALRASRRRQTDRP